MNRILVIDDQKDIAYLIQEVLRQEGFLVDVAFNGKEGLKKYFSFHFDLVITDLKMPKFNGQMVSEQIKKSDRHLTYLIGISGTPWKLDEKHFDAIIHKPFSLKRLIDQVEHFLQVREKIISS